MPDTKSKSSSSRARSTQRGSATAPPHGTPGDHDDVQGAAAPAGDAHDSELPPEPQDSPTTPDNQSDGEGPPEPPVDGHPGEPPASPPATSRAPTPGTDPLSAIVAAVNQLSERLVHLESQRAEPSRSGRRYPRDPNPLPHRAEPAIPRQAVEDHVTLLARDYLTLPPPADLAGGTIAHVYGLGHLLDVDDGALPIQLPQEAGASPARFNIVDPLLHVFRGKADAQSRNTGAWRRDHRHYDFLLGAAARSAVLLAQTLWQAVGASVDLAEAQRVDAPGQPTSPGFAEQSYANSVDSAWWSACQYIDLATQLDLLKLKVTHSIDEAASIAALHHDQTALGVHGPVAKLLKATHLERTTQLLKAQAKRAANRGRGGGRGRGRSAHTHIDLDDSGPYDSDDSNFSTDDINDGNLSADDTVDYVLGT
eukprot:CAMPEP_0206299814 /NCGR_PEP_ID=MMETSP0106_2-20121207/7380_1 /ASSEMBLY_ACC=CAM_ASM_000206 /TAXON_ID=81532 /ORGANISM="Acanthoeca-like sp., Strain 10tr" /LENGTH=422 /DNA_ID=CAMNT_0053730519 /DNA_START=71 /DNA_END=1336 /DNA_ORIENTATION=-